MDSNTIKQLIDSCIGKSISEIDSILNGFFDEFSSYVLESYDNSRALMQNAISQLGRVHNAAVLPLMASVLNRVVQLSCRFEKPIEHYDAYVNVDWKEADITRIMQKITPYFNGECLISRPNISMANQLTVRERQEIASFIIDSIRHHGTSTQWDKDTIENHQMCFLILYSICKVDKQLKWLYYFSGNFLDRLATSQQYQATRDMAENLLMVGYQEGMEAESYFCAARAYTILNQSLAGLLYMDIALRKWQQCSEVIVYKASFEILWQVLKLARGINFSSAKLLSPILNAFDALSPLAYDVLSFYHTYFSVLFFAKQDKVLDDIADFLDSHREIFFHNLEHSAMPWMSLLAAIKLNYPTVDTTRLELYVKAALPVVDYKGNALFLDLLNQEHEEEHVKELIVRLESTRNVEDYPYDNALAMLYAKMLLDKATSMQNPSQYILAMHVRNDFTFLRKSILQHSLYKKSEFIDVDGREYHLVIEDTNLLKDLMQQGENDEILWIGKGLKRLHYMSLLRNNFVFGDLQSLGTQNIRLIQENIIKGLTYERDVKKPGQSIYSKDTTELEQEAERLKTKLASCSIPVDEKAERLLIAKDLDVAAFPHQLLVETERNEFVGSIIPSCNIISTEVLIKTNFSEPLCKDFSCAYWSPMDSEEITFAMIKSRLETSLNKYRFSCNDNTNPMKPIASDINIACAHGGADISNTSWFYADEKPIVEITKIIGCGKLLVLFVCHSGTISRPDYENAMHTLIKQFIRMGYSSVIAPMWSLNTEILPLWLETFMECISQGNFVIDALFKANIVVKDKYISPEVYACLHLFGNPFLQIGNEPLLKFVERES